MVVVAAETVTAPVEPERRMLLPAASEVTPVFVKVRFPVEEVMEMPVPLVMVTATQFVPFEPRRFPALVVAMVPTVVPPVRRAPVVREETPVPPEATPSGLVSESEEAVSAPTEPVKVEVPETCKLVMVVVVRVAWPLWAIRSTLFTRSEEVAFTMFAWRVPAVVSAPAVKPFVTVRASPTEALFVTVRAVPLPWTVREFEMVVVARVTSPWAVRAPVVVAAEKMATAGVVCPMGVLLIEPPERVGFVEVRFVMVAVVPVAVVKLRNARVEEPDAVTEEKAGVVVTVKVWTPFAVVMASRLLAVAKVWVEEVEPLSEVMPVAAAGSHERPPGAVEEAVRT
jgi:hypothetical protein